MDGKDGEKKRPIKSCRTHVELHLRNADKRKSTQPGKGGVPQETNHSIVPRTNWVCGGTFADHECVLGSRIAKF